MKKLIALLLVPAYLITFSGCKGKKEVGSVENLIQKGKIYENIQQFNNAIDTFNKVLEKDPFSLEAYLHKGKSYQALGNYNEALESYKKGFVIDNKNIDFMRALAEVYYLKGNYVESLHYTELVRDIEATDPFTLNLIGKVNAAQGDLEQAAIWMERAVNNAQDNPNYALDYIRVLIALEQVDQALSFSQTYLQSLKQPNKDVSLMHADLLMRTKRFEEALTFLKILDKDYPDDPEVLSRIARYYFINEEDDTAMNLLNRALEKSPSHLQSLLLKGSLLLKQNKGAEALVIFQALARNFPNWPDVQLKLGAAYQLMGQWEQAKTAYQRLLQMVPGFVPAKISLANIYFRDGWYEEVDKLSQEVLKKEPNNVDALKIYAASLLTQKRYREAIDIYKQIIELSPDIKQSHAFLAELYLSNRDFQTAYIEAQKALKENPEDNRMLLVSGMCLKYLKLNERAQEVFQNILDKDPDYFPARFQLGEIYASQKLWDAAEEQYQKILNNQPDNIDVLLRIGTVYWRQGKIDKAESFFLDLLERFPEEYRLYYELGRLYAQQKKLDEAIAKFEEVVQRKPKHLLGNLLLANLYRQKGNVKRPEEIIRELITIRPGLNLENELVLLQLAQHKYAEALNTVRALPVQKQKSMKTQFAKGIALLLADEGEDAAITFRRLQEKLPYSIMFLVAYADSYLLIGSKDKALDTFSSELGEFNLLNSWYEQFVNDLGYSKKDQKASLEKVHLFLLFAYFQWGIQYEEAFDALPASAKDSPLFRMILANAYALSENGDRATEIYDSLVEEYPQSSYLHYQLGLFYLKKGETSSALQAFITAMKINPDTTRIRIPLVKLLLDNNRLVEAEQIALDSMKKNPDESAFYYLLSDLYAKQKRTDEAIEIMARLYEKNPEEINAALRLGQYYFQEHEYEKSADALTAFVVKNPRHLVGNSLYLRALLASDRDEDLVRLISSIRTNLPQLNTTMPEMLFYLKQGEFKKASRLLQNVDASAFVSSSNLYVMGLVFQAIGDLDQAKKYYLMAADKTKDKLLYLLAYLNVLKISASEEKYNENLGLLITDTVGSKAYSMMLDQIIKENDTATVSSKLFQMNLMYLYILNEWDKKAYDLLKNWIAEFPKNLFFYRISYYISERSRWSEKSLATLKQILQYYPKDTFALMQLGRNALAQGQESEAAGYFEKVLDIMAENQEAMTYLGMIYSNQGKQQDALKLYEKALELNPENVIVLNNLAYFYSTTDPKNLELALEYAQRAQKISPTNGPIADTLGWIYYQVGRYAEALVFLERARQMIPRFPEVYFHLGKTYLALKDSFKAKEAFEQVLKLDPKGKYSKETQTLLKEL